MTFDRNETTVCYNHTYAFFFDLQLMIMFLSLLSFNSCLLTETCSSQNYSQNQPDQENPSGNLDMGIAGLSDELMDNQNLAYGEFEDYD